MSDRRHVAAGLFGANTSATASIGQHASYADGSWRRMRVTVPTAVAGLATLLASAGDFMNLQTIIVLPVTDAGSVNGQTNSVARHGGNECDT
jgi:hypothetical protein